MASCSLPRIPALSPGLGAIAGALLWSAPLAALVLLTGVLGWEWKVRRRAAGRWVTLSVFLAVTLSAFWNLSRQAKMEARLAGTGGELVEGELVLGRMDPYGRFVGTFSEEGGEEISVEVSLPPLRRGELLPGARCEVRGRLGLPERARNPGQRDRLQALRNQGLVARLNCDRVTEEGLVWTLWPLRVLTEMRFWMKEVIVAGLPEEHPGRTVIPAMVLGLKPPPGDPVLEAFRQSGALHVFAVSGLHVTAVGLLFWTIFRLLGFSRRQAAGPVIVLIFAYAALTGWGPAAVRAAVMSAVYLGAFLLRRRPDGLNALALSLILALVLAPWQIFLVGFQLSYLVLAAILVGFDFCAKRLEDFGRPDPFLPRELFRIRQKIQAKAAEKLTVLLSGSIPAWCGSLPLMFWHFGYVTPMALLSGLFLMPLTFLILGLGLGAVALAPIWETGSRGVVWVNGFLADRSDRLTRAMSRVPLGHLDLPEKAPADLVIFDVRNGGGANLFLPGEGALIDGASTHFWQARLRPTLRRWKSWPRRAFLTHADGNHSGGLGAYLVERPATDLYLPERSARSPGFRELLKHDENRRWHARTGQVFTLGAGASLTVVAETKEGEARADDRGAVYRLDYQGWKILFTGDIGFERERTMSGKAFRADVVVMGLHKSHGHSGTLEFLREVRPKLVVVADVKFSQVERVRPFWKEALEAEGIEVWPQTETGAVLLRMQPNHLRAWSFLQEGRDLTWR